MTMRTELFQKRAVGHQNSKYLKLYIMLYVNYNWNIFLKFKKNINKAHVDISLNTCENKTEKKYNSLT